MDNKITNIKDRALQVAKKKGVSYEKFSAQIGMTYGSFKGPAKKAPLNSDAIVNILSNYPDVNAEWLIMGHGDMIKGNETVGIAQRSKIGIPLVPVDAVAGIMSGNSTLVMPYDCEYYDVPLFRGADFLISVKGDSMTPKYYSGDVVACKRLSIDTFFQWNKVYVVDSEQGVIIKRVRPGKNDNHILLVSENVDYPPFELERKKIYSIALVMGLVRAE